MTYEEWIAQVQKAGRCIVALDGPSGSGKSTLSRNWSEQYGWTVFHTDDYFLPEQAKTKERLNEPGGNLDWERLQQEILMHRQDDAIASHRFDCRTQQLIRREKVPRGTVLVIEGVYAMHPQFQPYLDFQLFLDVDPSVRTQRLRERNPVLWPTFEQEWIPMEDRYFETFHIRSQADLVYCPTCMDI